MVTDDLSDLEAYAAQVKNRPKSPVAPLPEIKVADPYVLRVEDLRSPFGNAETDEYNAAGKNPGLSPDLNRAKEELESFPLDGLQMVGTLLREKVLQALIKTSDGSIHLVHIGNYLGKNDGKIVSISEQQVDVIELVDEGGNGWRERPATLNLSHH